VSQKNDTVGFGFLHVQQFVHVPDPGSPNI
jgi:hypothetical protein